MGVWSHSTDDTDLKKNAACVSQTEGLFNSKLRADDWCARLELLTAECLSMRERVSFRQSQ